MTPEPTFQPFRLIRLAGGEYFRLFLLRLFDFFLLTVVAFTHNKLLVLFLVKVTTRGESATGKDR